MQYWEWGNREMDRITLKGMRMFGFHGVYPCERELGRHFEIDAELFLPLEEAGNTDDLLQTVNYAEVFEFIKSEFNKETYSLIETAAVRLARAVISRFPVTRVIIRVRKQNPPLSGYMDYAEVQVERSRQ